MNFWVKSKTGTIWTGFTPNMHVFTSFDALCWQRSQNHSSSGIFTAVWKIQWKEMWMRLRLVNPMQKAAFSISTSNKTYLVDYRSILCAHRRCICRTKLEGYHHRPHLNGRYYSDKDRDLRLLCGLRLHASLLLRYLSSCVWYCVLKEMEGWGKIRHHIDDNEAISRKFWGNMSITSGNSFQHGVGLWRSNFLKTEHSSRFLVRWIHLVQVIHSWLCRNISFSSYFEASCRPAKR